MSATIAEAAKWLPEAAAQWLRNTQEVDGVDSELARRLMRDTNLCKVWRYIDRENIPWQRFMRAVTSSNKPLDLSERQTPKAIEKDRDNALLCIEQLLDICDRHGVFNIDPLESAIRGNALNDPEAEIRMALSHIENAMKEKVAISGKPGRDDIHQTLFVRDIYTWFVGETGNRDWNEFSLIAPIVNSTFNDLSAFDSNRVQGSCRHLQARLRALPSNN